VNTTDPQPDSLEAREKTIREHTLSLHLMGEQLSQIESWFWAHLADVREAARQELGGPLPDDALPAPVSVPPAADRAALRDRIRRAVCEAEGFAWDSDMLEPDEYGEVADAVLSVLPASADRGAEERLARVLRWVTSDVVTAKTEFGNGYRAAQRDIRDLIRGRFDADAANELRRMAAETPQPETVPCANCGKPVRLITGTLATWWVHDPGGHTICDPQQAATSPRATPAAPAQPAKEARL
jgi:hypothetical protein